MFIWMANLIRLPVRQSNGIYWTARNVLEPTKLIEHSFTASAAPCLTTTLQQNYVSESSPRCERAPRNRPCEILHQMLGRGSQRSGANRDPFFLEPRGIG